MAPSTPRLRILSVGGNSVSAFLSWRLQATNACDVTLVWKSGFDAVAQYGITFKSKLFGNERFKPHQVVRSPEEASTTQKGPFDYVLLCVKALPDVYDLSAVIEPVVTPQHTCILVNTTHSLGVEAHLEQRFPTNVVLSLVSGAEITQLGASEFEHQGSTDVWVGPANKNPSIPASIQSDMAEALAMTLSSGQVDCKVSENIRQQQYERMIGPISFHPASVLFETPNHADLLGKVGVRPLVSDVIDEVLQIATAQGCSFPEDFKEKTMETMIQPIDARSIMYQDFTARRPMEVETYLGSPIKLAQELGVHVPRIETLYALLHHINTVNQSRPAVPPTSPGVNGPMVRPGPLSRPPSNGGPMNGPMRNGMRSRVPSGVGPPPPQMRRAPPSANGFPPRPLVNGNYPPRGPSSLAGAPPPGQLSRRPSLEGNDLEDFSHVVLYDNIPEGGVPDGAGAPTNVDLTMGSAAMNTPHSELNARERDLMLRARELALREQEFNMRRGPPRKPQPSPRRGGGGGSWDDDDDDEYFDPLNSRAPVPMIDPDNVDMMSITSKRNRKIPSVNQLRKNPEMASGSHFGFGRTRPGMSRNRTSTALMQDVPGLHDSIMDNALLGYSSDRYGDVDRARIGHESRANSLTAARLDELSISGSMPGGYPAMARRPSQSPGDPYNPGRRTGRPSPPNGPNGYMGPNGPPTQGSRPSPPGMMRAPIPRHPPGQGNTVAPQQVEQHAGVSNLYPPKSAPNVRSLTGSASASAASGESAQIDSENSAHSSQSSLGPRPNTGI
ncbi:hypothetical protein L228DRAFT_278953 [Xylona heveae TC161]|uniref:ApbA-domain-containing protein n=1 Tax=Xylona heveae (strain CBS 132557 / TC161) TaxID=1328760 RepID=A0A165FE94_XYLHT|nr:hypothetical protein L228DRAFT_278953 [Xylona heveae TC161]KZF20880.1 hypothetical protein L228DRAFT_278953 [Xylona heveae TC161]